MEIADWRKKIDGLDEQIVSLLSERAKAATEIGAIKQRTNASIYEPDREQAVYSHVKQSNPGPLTEAELIVIYERIMDVMRSLQRRTPQA
jgi:chorismate mutase